MNENEMRARFHALTAEVTAIRKKSDPLRAKRDKVSQETRAREMALNKELRTLEDGIFEIDQERAFLVRALKGVTGTPPA